MMQRIFAGVLTALLVSISSLAAACDLSCEFPRHRTDCTCTRTESQPHGSMKMEMPRGTTAQKKEMYYGNRIIYIDAKRSVSMHALIGELGSCERHSCDPPVALFAKTIRFSGVQFEMIGAIAGFSQMERLQPIVQNARDATVPLSFVISSPLTISLRI